MFQYLELFQNQNRDTIQLSEWIEKNIKQDRESLEHICDYFMWIDNPNYKLSYKNALSKAQWWVESMKKDTTGEIEWVDYEIVYHTKDWLMKFVKLLTKVAYENESANMRHCIQTYWGNDREVFSLRDNKNMPHATMDIVKDQDKIMQIQWKWDTNVDGKYQEYNIEFLKSMWFTINSSFMKKIGYKSVKALYNVINNTLILDEFIKEDEEVQFKNWWRYGTFQELIDGWTKIIVQWDVTINK